MAFWLAVLVGGLFVWIAVQIGFHATWILFFNILVSIYLAVALTPVFIASIPDAFGYGCGLTLISIFFAGIFVTYGLCYACLSGQFYADFPKLFDTTIAGVFGFLSGFLLWSFFAFALSLTPLAEFGVMQMLGFHKDSQSVNRSYIGWWCNRLHGMVGSVGTSDEMLNGLMGKAPGPDLSGWTSPRAPTAPSATASSATTSSTATTPSTPATESKSGSGRAQATSPQPRPDTANPPQPKPNLAAPGTNDGHDDSPATVAPPSPAANQEPPRIRHGARPDPTDDHTEPATPAAPDQQFPPLTDSLATGFARRRAQVDDAKSIGAAFANQDIRLMILANRCTAGTLTPAQRAQLKEWVDKGGGVLWATNDVLKIFDVEYVTPAEVGDRVCQIAADAEKSPAAQVVVDCREVTLKDFQGQACIRATKDAVPLLTVKDDVSDDFKAGTACWTLIRYGKGWISDPKTVDVAQADGSHFWQNFCAFCLRMKSPKTASGATSAPGPLSGILQMAQSSPVTSGATHISRALQVR